MRISILISTALSNTLVDSGPPPLLIPTGTAITKDQWSAVLFPETCMCKFKSMQFYLQTELLKPPYNHITVSLCKQFNSKPNLENCIEKNRFELPSTKQIEAVWDSSLNPDLNNEPIWFVLQGDAEGFQSSFTWQDAENFNATTAFYLSDSREWVVEDLHRQGSTVKMDVDLLKCAK